MKPVSLIFRVNYTPTGMFTTDVTSTVEPTAPFGNPSRIKTVTTIMVAATIMMMEIHRSGKIDHLTNQGIDTSADTGDKDVGFYPIVFGHSAGYSDFR